MAISLNSDVMSFNNDAMPFNNDVLNRAEGCMLGQLAGDSLGSLVEFKHPSRISEQYPDGVRIITAGGTWDTLAGQPTDDSEMALLLARSLVAEGKYSPTSVYEAYVYWVESGPFDCGVTIGSALKGRMNPSSQANGAMMRISPLGIFGVNYELSAVGKWAREDCILTHPNLLCQQANALFAMAISFAIKTGAGGAELYQNISRWARHMKVDEALSDVIIAAENHKPSDYVKQMGWVLIAFQSTLWHLLHTNSFEEALVETIGCGGDTDTNAAICGALLGAVYGRSAIPGQWVDAVLSCRPEAGLPAVLQPRPECFWPVDALDLVSGLLGWKLRTK